MTASQYSVAAPELTEANGRRETDLAATILRDHQRRQREYEQRLESLLSMLDAIYEEGCALKLDDEDWGMGIGNCAGSIERALAAHRGKAEGR